MVSDAGMLSADSGDKDQVNFVIDVHYFPFFEKLNDRNRCDD